MVGCCASSASAHSIHPLRTDFPKSGRPIESVGAWLSWNARERVHGGECRGTDLGSTSAIVAKP
jgi:hypothetical protein